MITQIKCQIRNRGSYRKIIIKYGDHFLENDNKDKRVETIITNILSGKWLSYSVEQNCSINLSL